MSATVETMLPSALAVSYQGASTSGCPACHGLSSNRRRWGLVVVALAADVICGSLWLMPSGPSRRFSSSWGNGTPVTSSRITPTSL